MRFLISCFGSTVFVIQAPRFVISSVFLIFSVSEPHCTSTIVDDVTTHVARSLVLHMRIFKCLNRYTSVGFGLGPASPFQTSGSPPRALYPDSIPSTRSKERGVEGVEGGEFRHLSPSSPKLKQLSWCTDADCTQGQISSIY